MTLRVKILASCLLVLVTALMSLWLYGFFAPPPPFVLGSPESGRIVLAEWTWWRQTADRFHGRQYAMLSFDDGPADHETNLSILATLERHHVHAAFFCLCRNAQSPIEISDLKSIADSGHTIANHTFNHLRLPTLNFAARQSEIVTCRDHLKKLSGQKVHWFRPPYGLLSPDIETILNHNEQQLVMWSANSGDTWLSDRDAIIDKATSEAKDGTILLLHSLPLTASALDSILTRLEQQGFRFVVAEDRTSEPFADVR